MRWPTKSRRRRTPTARPRSASRRTATVRSAASPIRGPRARPSSSTCAPASSSRSTTRPATKPTRARPPPPRRPRRPPPRRNEVGIASTQCRSDAFGRCSDPHSIALPPGRTIECSPNDYRDSNHSDYAFKPFLMEQQRRGLVTLALVRPAPGSSLLFHHSNRQ
ncbi:hypothetical protein PSP6_960009 [Paraburkholderia tropica]|nr:hypothetical protein PSP6_960009 [Paraburkholderia tropica]